MGFAFLQPISEWSSSHVVEWMAALNLYRYADVFRCKDIKGSDLVHLDKEKLMVSQRKVYDVFQILCGFLFFWVEEAAE